MTSAKPSPAGGLHGLRAAAYARMSTDLQDQSIAQQLDFIARFAADHQCSVVRVYRDAGRSGLTASRRAGLQRMLADIAAGAPGYDIVLVLDVSRWGRYQDIDESAYYEFLCRRGGIRVIYCAEAFGLEDNPLQHLFKDVKRIMAAEHSRELSQRVFDAHAALLRQGYKPGGAAGFGLRRLCLRADGSPRGLLAPGERKSHPTDRVVLVPGPAEEVAAVRRIYHLYCAEGLTCRALARRLNAEAGGGKPWTDSRVRAILGNEKYCGNLLYNRISERLGGRRRRNPPAEWLRHPEAHAGIITAAEFAEACRQRCLRREPDVATILEKLRDLYGHRGLLSRRISDAEPGLPHSDTLKKLFGSVHQAYQLALGAQIEYMPRESQQARFARQAAALREQVSACIRRTAHTVRPGPRAHLLIVDDAITVRLSSLSSSHNNGAWGWLIPTRATQADFVICALRPWRAERSCLYALLRAGPASPKSRWIAATAPERSGVWLSPSLDPFFGLD